MEEREDGKKGENKFFRPLCVSCGLVFCVINKLASSSKRIMIRDSL